MVNLTFHNRENAVYNINNAEIWHSRSVALHGILCVRLYPDVDYILLTKRSEKCPDEVGKIANVSGYLDWDESAYEALCREYYEETHLDLAGLIQSGVLLKGSVEQPYYVQSDPKKDARQNVAMRFRMHILVYDLPLLIESEETSSVEWVSISTLLPLLKHPESFAWNHAEVIHECLEYFLT